MRGHIDGCGEGLGETLEASIVSTSLRQLIESSLGVLDLIAWRKIDRCVVGDIDHALADLDQRAPDRQFVNGMAVILRIDDGRRLGGESRQVLADRETANIDACVKEGLECDRRSQLSRADQIARQLIDRLMDWLE